MTRRTTKSAAVSISAFLICLSAQASPTVESTLYSFGATTSDGTGPEAALIQGSDGNFYGTTVGGGTGRAGTVFKLTPAGVETVLYSFGSNAANNDGAYPYSSVIQASDGNFYGTATGGTHGTGGAVFKVTPDGIETLLHFFNPQDLTDGNTPQAALVQGRDGNFYGTTNYGGKNNRDPEGDFGDGTIFKITADGTETVLYSFGSSSVDGRTPIGTLILGSDGNFYGTTQYGGAHDNGTVFKVTPSGVETVLYSFGDRNADGAQPFAGLVQGNDGNFYGTAQYGGANASINDGKGGGIVFKVTPAGVESVLYSFGGSGANDANPQAPLVQGNDGNFYGATTYNGGLVFELTPDGTETVLSNFKASPLSGLIQGKDGNFYGTGAGGGTKNFGMVFRLTSTSSSSSSSSSGGSSSSGSSGGGAIGFFTLVPMIFIGLARIRRRHPSTLEFVG
ncbi:choice-of-anchor tandem repeat GloVer-containing protein [Nevskia soli]|uniref:choice-of-anchor tandem repeat GloVer-containing protein n=1 Tax=Nevskia soli TaxID=418856 RepID=UPI000A5671E4|nr:choice-of-anchor tandem repeat GloVer-containing protein [Nevskia soli]